MAGGYRPNSGRPHEHKDAVKIISAHGIALEDAEGFLMRLVNDDAVPLSERTRAAIALLPFQKAKLAEVAAIKKHPR